MRKNVYFPAKFIRNSNEIVVWKVDAKKIKEAVENKKVKGIVIKKDVLITADKESVNQFFKGNKNEMLYLYEQPTIFRKLRYR